ncbi:PREDICTED: UPF0481 [Prunus dulcis]|uniref:PREDICTED: UPF0481 n=1 Tax=Prunus dulcis TaxID=3755 RepID=A0A5E4F7C4_PRUDU|nr:hypothetical protein L3X38_037741 [Prunus dulcis]VVA23943.1 PREDICTED: UPF0481 [Prunus dulcis]
MGPINQCKYKEADELKYILAADFIHDSGQKDEDLYKKIKDCIKLIKDCYDMETTKCYDDDGATLAWILFIDGCSTLQFIYKRHCLEEYGMKRDQEAFAEQDLFLPENQLPYQITAAEEPPDGYKRGFQQREGRPINIGEEPQPAHLLDLLRKRLLGPALTHMEKWISTEDRSPLFHNAQELKAARIHFGRGKGFLSLPPINEDAMSLFLNLIAYEMCPDFLNDFVVTSFFGFPSSLVDHPDDAKQLRSARIFCNLRGSEEALADLFHEIGPDLVPTHSIYNIVSAN